MKLVDVTLRDGGFVCDFNWGLEYAINHICTVSKMGIPVIELGYWKQNAKSVNPFYNMNESLLAKLTEKMPSSSIASVMIDYHYCNKDLNEYPKFGDTRLELVRITSRKEDFEDAVKFGKALKNEKGLKVSFQIINSTNYSKIELIKFAETLINNQFEKVAFADSHGNLNLIKDMSKYEEAIKLLDDNAVEWGFHLHDHAGRATLNYWLLTKTTCSFIDVSANGVGKGIGNLKMEHVVNNEILPLLLNYMMSDAHPQISLKQIDAYNLMTGRMNVTDNYAKFGYKNKISSNDFMSILSRINGKDKDTYNQPLIKNLVDELL